MKLYPENYDVTIRVAFTDLNGDAIVPTAVRAALYDGEDAEVVDFGSLPFDGGLGYKDIVIPATFNILGEGKLQDARILRIELDTAAGTIRRSSTYIIEGEHRLVVMENSFITLEAAEIAARDMPHLSGWDAAGDEQRAAALINAYHRLQRVSMKFTELPAGASRRELDCYPETLIPASQWPHVDAAEFMTFPAHFRTAVRHAQVAEANDILENDVYAQKHRAGIISETVGESSVMLRGARLELPVSKRAFDYLTGYVFYRMSIVRR